MEKRSRDRDRDNDDFDGGGKKDGGSKGFSFRRRKSRPPVDAIFDYKDIETLKGYISDEGKIMPGRVSRMNRQQQNQLTVAVKRARQLALLPTCPRHG